VTFITFPINFLKKCSQINPTLTYVVNCCHIFTYISFYF